MAYYVNVEKSSLAKIEKQQAKFTLYMFVMFDTGGRPKEPGCDYFSWTILCTIKIADDVAVEKFIAHQKDEKLSAKIELSLLCAYNCSLKCNAMLPVSINLEH